MPESYRWTLLEVAAERLRAKYGNRFPLYALRLDGCIDLYRQDGGREVLVSAVSHNAHDAHTAILPATVLQMVA